MSVFTGCLFDVRETANVLPLENCKHRFEALFVRTFDQVRNRPQNLSNGLVLHLSTKFRGLKKTLLQLPQGRQRRSGDSYSRIREELQEPHIVEHQQIGCHSV